MLICLAHLLVDSDFRYLETSASGGSKTSFSGQKWPYFQTRLLSFKDIEHWRGPKDAPCKATYFTYQARNYLINIGELIWGNSLAKTGTELAGSRFSCNRYSRHCPKTGPLLTLDGTKWQPQRKREGNCYGQNADIGYKSTPVVGSTPYDGIHLRTHLWIHTDIQCLRCQGWEGLGPLLWYNLSWSSHDLPLFTIPADVAAPQEQKFTFSGVVGSLPHIYGANIWQNPRPNKQLELGQLPCVRSSIWLLQSADNQLAKVKTH